MELRVPHPELLGALSLATDLGTGQPLEHALGACLVTVALGERAGVSDDDLAAAYDLALLHSIGCTADAFEAAQLYGDDIAVRAAYAAIDPTDPRQLLGFLARNAGAGRPALPRAAMFAGALAAGPRRPRAAFAAHCEVAQRLAPRFGVGERARAALGFVFERWDGRGYPAGARGEAIPVAARLLHVARDAVLLRAAGEAAGAGGAAVGVTGEAAAAGGAPRVAAIITGRAGAAYDPALAAAFGDDLCAALDRPDRWAAAMSAAPDDRVPLAGEALDAACRAAGEFADLKSPWTLGHSAAVAELAEAAAWRLGLGAEEAAAVRRAGLLHDLGRVGVSNAIWDKPGPLGEAERERVRLHPYFTERALARSPRLSELGAVAAAHHERLDGSGYHRGVPAAMLGLPARLLAAADTFQAMTEPRPHRPAHTPDAAAEQLRAEAAAGRLDADAVDAVLAAAGRPVPRRERPAGLSEREIEVLRLLARGLTNRQMAAELGLSAKTVGHHVQHIYAKAGVGSRAAAALFAVENDLVRPGA
ncbi:MAG TPA: HD domain-containing phosphohydrolase [Solirubrobacteraceae bacterium]